MGNIDIQTDEIQATAVVRLFICESLSRKQRVPADPRKASSMPRSGLLGLVAGLRATQRQRCLPGDFTRLGIVLELGSPETPHTEETESAVYFLYSLG